MKVYCDCKYRKMDASCDKIRAGFVLSCDEICINRQNELKRIADEQDRARREQQEEKNRQELEEFEKKFGKKKHKERKPQIIEQTDNSHIYKWAGIGVGVAVLAAFIYFLLSQ